MDWESSGVVGFYLGPLLQGQTTIAKLKSAYNLLVLKTVNQKPICRPKDSDPVMFRFLLTKTGFVTYFIILT